MRFGTAIAVGAAAALACTLPAATRVVAVASAEGAPRVWIALAAAALGPMVAAVLVLRGAREGLRAYGGEGAELRFFGIALWLSSLFVALALFGSVLRATTHQHALAGVTFAFGALALAATSGLVCARLVTILRNAPRNVRRVIGSALALLTLAALAWVSLRFLHAIARDAASAMAAGSVVDVLAFSVAAGFAAHPSLIPRRALALAGPPFALVLALLGVATLRDPRFGKRSTRTPPPSPPRVDLLPNP